MHLTTVRQVIQRTAKRWRQTYEPFTNGALLKNKTKHQIALELDAMNGDTATKEDVAHIIGNDSWTRLTCDECGDESDAVLSVGQEPDYESHTASLCKACVEKAGKAFEL